MLHAGVWLVVLPPTWRSSTSRLWPVLLAVGESPARMRRANACCPISTSPTRSESLDSTAYVAAPPARRPANVNKHGAQCHQQPRHIRAFDVVAGNAGYQYHSANAPTPVVSTRVVRFPDRHGSWGRGHAPTPSSAARRVNKELMGLAPRQTCGRRERLCECSACYRATRRRPAS